MAVVNIPINPLRQIEAGARYIAGYVVKHPVQVGIIAATAVGLGVGAVVTGGADLAAAPEVIDAELGATAVNTTALTDALTASGAVGAASAASDAGVGVAESEAAAAESAGTFTRLAGAARTVFRTLQPAIKYGSALYAVGLGTAAIGEGLANIRSAIVGTPTQLPYSTLPGPFGLPIGLTSSSLLPQATPSTSAEQATPPQAKPGLPLSEIGLIVLLFIVGLAAVYLASRRRSTQ